MFEEYLLDRRIDRYQSTCQYHRPMDSLLYVWPNRNDKAYRDTANAVSKLEGNFHQTEG